MRNFRWSGHRPSRRTFTSTLTPCSPLKAAKKKKKQTQLEAVVDAANRAADALGDPSQSDSMERLLKAFAASNPHYRMDDLSYEIPEAAPAAKGAQPAKR